MKKRWSVLLAMALILAMAAPVALGAEAPKTITENELGTHGGYDYELWKDSGVTSMTLKDGGAFSCTWSDINNALFRKGVKFDETQTHGQLGNITLTYDCDYQPKGNSYLCAYGWTSEPLVEYYVVDSWGDWRPPGVASKGTISVDGGKYDIYETTRTQQPSIKGTATFQQYWSVRASKRASGTISLSEHFKAWESLGMNMGKMYEAALVVEGYQSSGSADVLSNTVTVGGESAPQEVAVAAAAETGLRRGTAAFGTPVLDGQIDDIWNQAEVLPIDRMLQAQETASGTARVLWDRENLYVLFEVTAEVLDNKSVLPYECSSVEAFVDEGNCKLGSYKEDDGQYRVCYDGAQTFGDWTKTGSSQSVAAVDGLSYLVEMKIPFRTLAPEAGMEIGFDAQVNDAKNGARTGMAKWNDPTNNSWQNTSGWGIVTLVQ